MKQFFLVIIGISMILSACSPRKSNLTHYADYDYSCGTGLETYDGKIAGIIDTLNMHNPFKTEFGFILEQIQMEDECLRYIIKLDDGVTSKDLDWKSFDKEIKDGTWDFLKEHSARVRFYTISALCGRHLIYDFYENGKNVHSVKIWPGDYIDDVIY